MTPQTKWHDHAPNTIKVAIQAQKNHKTTNAQEFQ